MNHKIKQLGQVITPDWLVQEILNASEYMGEHILCRYALEPACGDGQFLGEMVKRYIQAGKTAKLTNTQIASQLSQYIVGIEIDPTMYQTCIKRLNQLAQTSLGMSVDWQIYQKNTLDIYKNYPAYFDWIVGNPSYVRLHHLDNNIRQILKSKFEFTHGTTDLYLAFFEMAFFMLNKTGKLAFITPNSFLYNTSYQKFRDYLAQQKKLSALCDLKANKVFDGFSTYTAISVFDNAWQKDYFTYKEFVNGKFKIINQIYFNQLTAKKWGFSDPKNSEFLARINSHQNKLEDYFNIQYGFATLRDKIFIGKYTKQKNALGLFNGMIIEEAILRPIIKASRYKGLSDDTEYVLFPYYDNKGRYIAYTETDLAQQFPHAYAYLLHHKDELLKRDIDKKAQWFEFGRSQGIQTCHQEKIVISTLVNQKIHYFKLPKEVLVYSGIFLTKKSDDVDWQIAENALSSQDFLHYVRLTGKDMSGGYKSLSSKQIKAFSIIHHE